MSYNDLKSLYMIVNRKQNLIFLQKHFEMVKIIAMDALKHIFSCAESFKKLGSSCFDKEGITK